MARKRIGQSTPRSDQLVFEETTTLVADVFDAGEHHVEHALKGHCVAAHVPGGEEAAVASQDAVVIGNVVAFVSASEAEAEVVELDPVRLLSVGLGLLYLTYEARLHLRSFRRGLDKELPRLLAPGPGGLFDFTYTGSRGSTKGGWGHDGDWRLFCGHSM